MMLQHEIIALLLILLIPTFVVECWLHTSTGTATNVIRQRQKLPGGYYNLGYNNCRTTTTISSVTSVQEEKAQTIGRSIISPLSLTLDELSGVLGGKGRALLCWECFCLGVDPLWYHKNEEDSTNPFEPHTELLMINDDGACENHLNTRNGIDKFSSETTRRKRRRQNSRLGGEALNLFKDVFGGSIESTIASLVDVSISSDGTTKLLLRLCDGFEVETVIIPWGDRRRSTLCISSQVGCRQGCTFCATGKMGKLRSLTADEILAQVYWANKACRLRDIYSIDNIVFMGMGEPADNAEAVVLAADVLVDPLLFQLTPRRVTISTVGPSPEAFHNIGKAPVQLAWSVHATRDSVRRQLVPTTQYSMRELRDEGLIPVLNQRSKRLRTTMLEIALLEGINDNPEDALDLVEFCQPLLTNVADIKVTVNLIPWNDIRTSSSSPFSGDVALKDFRRPSMARVLAFQKILQENNILCYIRTTRGDDESAACGQLATKKKRRQD